ncbi:MAG: HAD family hydrolase [Candidatus Aenigmatarchaeota archaeon]
MKAIIFDYNGTLVDDLRFHESAYYKAAKEVGSNVTMEDIGNWISLSPIEKMKRILGKEDINQEDIKLLRNLTGKYYIEEVGDTNILFDGVEDVLSYLSQKYVLSIVTNSSKDKFDPLFPQKLKDMFKVMIFSGQIKNPKPSPDALLKAAEDLGLPVDECVYVGDSLIDIKAAKAANMNIILIATGRDSKEELEKAGAETVLNNIRELKDML